MRRPSARRGMTLVELTVGIVVAGLVVTAAYAAFSTIIDRREHASRVAAEGARAAGLRRTLFRWLDGATPRVSSGVPGVPGGSAGGSFGSGASGGNDELRVITLARTPMRALRTEVRLFVDDGRSGYARGLVAVLHPDRGGDSLRVMLDPSIVDARAEYLVTVNGVRDWRPASEVGSATPLAIRVRLRSADPTLDAALAEPVVAPALDPALAGAAQ